MPLFLIILVNFPLDFLNTAKAALTPQPPLPQERGSQNLVLVPLSCGRGAGGEGLRNFCVR